MLYTKRGDTGLTDLANGSRVQKNSPEMEAVGTLDELNAHLGLLSAQMRHTELEHTDEDIRLIAVAQRKLFAVGAVCAGIQNPKGMPTESDTKELEQAIDSTCSLIGTAFSGFILPGGHLAAAECHVTRTICRRAERCLLQAGAAEWAEGDECLPYINRLSDYLFSLARKINFLTKTKEIKY